MTQYQLKQHTFLLFPQEWPFSGSVDQDNRLSGAMILVVEVDVVGVLLADGNRGHGGLSRCVTPEVHVTSGFVFGSGEFITVVNSADAGHGLCGTEELLSALRRFACRNPSRRQSVIARTLADRRAWSRERNACSPITS